MQVEVAEQAAEGQMLRRRKRLVAEEDDEVLGERAVDLVELPFGQRLARDRCRAISAPITGVSLSTVTVS